ncbi:hypothetical protein CRE_09439 [Caenorhabditis remanei]|uniref:Serpentine Receptor, class H n=1 Tax=Caenorhabditis remanei TaxID=31234 RepID=E3LIV4_CAERE|nr:hypothetical protein CRE_09439 [Caenorhabditis remanei]
MVQTLEEYYLKNYSQCNLEYSFLASWQGLAYPSYVLQVIALPFQAISFYVIIKKTPNKMTSLKYPMLICHFWATLLNSLFCTFETPYVFHRMAAVFTVGLFSYFQVSTQLQLLIGTTCSYTFLFESRSSSLQTNRFKITRKVFRVIYHSMFFLVNSTISWIFFITPTNQEAAKMQALEADPCPNSEFFKFDVLILTTNQNLLNFIIWIHGPFILLHAVGHLQFHVSCLVYYLYYAPSTLISKNTQRLQRQFFVRIVFQTGVHFVFIAIPFLFMAFIHAIDCQCQEIMNLSTIIVGLHGLMSSISILLVHNVYRKAVVKMMCDLGSKALRVKQYTYFLFRVQKRSANIIQARKEYFSCGPVLRNLTET